MKRFEGTTAVITGGTMGIGFAIARHFGREGATVIIASRKQKNIDSAVQELTKQGIKCYGKSCNAGKSSDIKELVKFAVEKSPNHKIDFVVPNAAANPYFGPTMKAPEWSLV